MATDEMARHADEPDGAAVRCANCGIAVEGQPFQRDDRAYCCDGCAEGGPCTC